ncbi:hypothetical protein BLNAU_10333 [Blattamonas nauphoetae]|uniref:Uncharacterized protein n=1 Tax=Blattamonas nauphoetae TaxID=2049346 RepID=A0ABQ9XT67_9EUKA|nr:hypothetical protein BLNAU_10333 [Blattamonas nauphoetae]
MDSTVRSLTLPEQIFLLCFDVEDDGARVSTAVTCAAFAQLFLDEYLGLEIPEQTPHVLKYPPHRTRAINEMLYVIERMPPRSIGKWLQVLTMHDYLETLIIQMIEEGFFQLRASSQAKISHDSLRHPTDVFEGDIVNSDGSWQRKFWTRDKNIKIDFNTPNLPPEEPFIILSEKGLKARFELKRELLIYLRGQECIEDDPSTSEAGAPPISPTKSAAPSSKKGAAAKEDKAKVAPTNTQEIPQLSGSTILLPEKLKPYHYPSEFAPTPENQIIFLYRLLSSFSLLIYIIHISDFVLFESRLDTILHSPESLPSKQPVNRRSSFYGLEESKPQELEAQTPQIKPAEILTIATTPKSGERSKTPTDSKKPVSKDGKKTKDIKATKDPTPTVAQDEAPTSEQQDTYLAHVWECFAEMFAPIPPLHSLLDC